MGYHGSMKLHVHNHPEVDGLPEKPWFLVKI